MHADTWLWDRKLYGSQAHRPCTLRNKARPAEAKRRTGRHGAEAAGEGPRAPGPGGRGHLTAYDYTQYSGLPGMTATVDMRTEERSVLNFLLRPMLKSKEAFRER